MNVFGAYCGNPHCDECCARRVNDERMKAVVMAEVHKVLDELEAAS